MRRYLIGLLLWTVVAGVVPASTYTVTNTDDSGAGSLRWAIGRANGHAGTDTIRFAAEVNGRAINVLSRLPTITDAYTIIRGDSNGNGYPDVRLHGAHLTSFLADCGLKITGDHCTVSGLAISGFPFGGIHVVDAQGCRITGCYLGTGRLGDAAIPNGEYDIRLLRADYCTVGGTSPRERNVIEGASAGWLHERGISIEGGIGNTVLGNHIGLGRDGLETLGGEGFYGVVVTADQFSNPPRAAESNVIGGEAAGARNLFGGLQVGVALLSGPVADTSIVGDIFGLAADDDTVVPIEQYSVVLDSDTVSGTLIGGTGPGARNVFVSGGIYVDEAGTQNRIQGNYFGSNAAGTAQRPLQTGIVIAAGPQARLTVGGASAAAGNTFAPGYAQGGTAVKVVSGGVTTLRNNTIGVLPNGTDTSSMLTGVLVQGTAPRIEGNLVANALLAGVAATGADANPGIFGNQFRDCRYAVYIVTEARSRLGNVGNASSRDDGGNVFEHSNEWFIYNWTPNAIKAEGNDFDALLRKQINAKIHDRLDEPGLGLVDWQPDARAMPDSAGLAALALSGVGAVATRSGAQVIFSLSAPADVTVDVLTIAGRPVARVAQEVAAAGRQRLVWSGLTAGGTPAPSGTYLVRVLARDAAGQQASALASLSLRR